MTRVRFVAVCCLLLPVLAGRRAVSAAGFPEALAELNSAVPADIAGFQRVAFEKLNHASLAVESAAAEAARTDQRRSPPLALAVIERFLAAKQRVDRKLEQTLALRSEVAKVALALPEETAQRDMLRNYLAVSSQLIDLAGRLRYLNFDVLRGAPSDLAGAPYERQRLLELLLQYRCAAGPTMLSDALFEPEPAGRFARPQGASIQERSRLLELIAVTGQTEMLPQLARLVIQPAADPRLVVQAAETIRRVGLPQDPRPGQDPALARPAITARQLRAAVGQVAPQSLDRDWQPRRAAMLTWLDERIARGVPADKSLMIGPCMVQPGDWLLMRNPSPYNLFTDLSPGLFTHVGVVAWEKGSDGLGRMVLVDLPERGTKIPATNVDTFLQRTRHYLFLRHPDPAVAQKMGETAASVIGNPSEFDMNFRTDRVLALVGQPLAGKKIHTYCAGLLLLCALQTGLPREEFFPVTEFHAGGLSAENLATLGMSFGEGFISPTGALFSSRLQIVGRREPVYDPRREVEEAIYDHFAAALMKERLNVSPDLFQSLRLKMANAAKENSLLAQALATAAGVSPDMDLVSAAKAVAVVEILDEVAYGNSDECMDAIDAIKAGSLDPQGRTADAMGRIQKYRSQHAALLNLWQQGRLAPRALRVELVKYYIQRGRQQIDQRFFGPAGKAPTKPSDNSSPAN